MTSRERVALALDHREADRVPLDVGGSAVTGMHVSTVYRLRQAIGLDEPGTPVKVVEPYQMLGEIKPDLMEWMGADVLGLSSDRTLFGFRNQGWKPWVLPPDTPVLVPEGFNTVPDAGGDILMYPEGDTSVPPSGRMPRGGFYFDTLPRQEDIDEASLDPEDNLQEFQPIDPKDLSAFAESARKLYTQTDKAVLANFGGTGFGDIALVPAPWLKRPKGIRDVEEWYVSTAMRREYVRRVFERQCAIALENLEKLREATEPCVSILFVSGTDFGMQTGSFISPDSYRDLYKPFHQQLNQWVHSRTSWKTFLHSCGSVVNLLDDFIDAGFDILNPVQCSASGMDPADLKRKYGQRIVFWGGGSDTQRTLPFGDPEEVYREVKERIAVFGQGGGFVFGAIHNIQARIPEQNLMAFFRAYRENRDYQ
jgi:hypothetical protein